MPIARVMNMPDGSTPPVPIGGGDVNGTLNTALWAHAGTGANAIAVPTHLHFQCSKAGIPSVAVPSADEGEGQPVAIEEGVSLRSTEDVGASAATPDEMQGAVSETGIEATVPEPEPEPSLKPAPARRR